MIRLNKHNKAMRNNIRENNKRVECQHNIGDLVLLDYKRRKLDQPHEGPFEMLNFDSNGTVLLQKGRAETKVNIRQLHPFWRRRCDTDMQEPVITQRTSHSTIASLTFAWMNNNLITNAL